MVLHNSILKFDFAYKMIILRQYSKKNYRKIPKSSKFCIKSQILNCLEFNNYWILLDKIKIYCRISIPESLFPLLVFEFETSGADIMSKMDVLIELFRKNQALTLKYRAFLLEFDWLRTFCLYSNIKVNHANIQFSKLLSITFTWFDYFFTPGY